LLHLPVVRVGPLSRSGGRRRPLQAHRRPPRPRRAACPGRPRQVGLRPGEGNRGAARLRPPWTVVQYQIMRRPRFAPAEKGSVMTQQPDLWEFLEQAETKEALRELTDKDAVRHKTIKRLRASGHWLTLLRVARTIAQPFTLNDISVAVWRACPDFFGMKGYPYPDNHKVHYILYGDRGLIAKGLIRRVQQGLFTVPEEVDPDKLALEETEEE